MLLVKLFLFTLLYRFNLTYKVLLVFPVPGKSHGILGEGYVRHLLDAGHEVTYITHIRIDNICSRLRQIEISSDYLMPLEQLFEISEMIKLDTSSDVISQQLYSVAGLAYNTIMHPNIQALIHDTSEHFDIVIAEWLLSELYSGLSTVFNCPLIWSSSLEPHSLALELIDDVLNPAYNPSYRSKVLPPFGFLDRVKELSTMMTVKFHRWWLYNTEDRYFQNAFATSVEKRGRKLPPYHEVRYNASLMFGNSNVASGSSIHLPQNYIAIGGYHIQDDATRLAPNIKTILDDAQNGLIYFSLGMMEGNRVPYEMKKAFLDTFRKLSQTVLWKSEEIVDELPKNVHVVTWAPQTGVLAHPNCKLFITHGGILSIIEAIHFRVPIIGLPLFGDQYVNVNRAVEKGFGKRLYPNSEIGLNLEVAIQEILYSDKYYEKIKELSFIYHDRVTPPGKLLTHWVSHVIRTKGAVYLRSPALVIPWYQRLYIDLAFVIIITLYFAWKISLAAFNRVKLSGSTYMNRLKQKIL